MVMEMLQFQGGHLVQVVPLAHLVLAELQVRQVLLAQVVRRVRRVYHHRIVELQQIVLFYLYPNVHKCK